MPNDFVYDYHEHHDHIHRTTGYSHIHDRHPYHHHDHFGSIHYHDSTRRDRDLYRTVDRPWDDLPDVDNRGADAPAASLIGESGYDVTHRTPRPTPPHRPVD